jgi:hypothetical protein
MQNRNKFKLRVYIALYCIDLFRPEFSTLSIENAGFWPSSLSERSSSVGAPFDITAPIDDPCEGLRLAKEQSVLNHLRVDRPELDAATWSASVRSAADKLRKASVIVADH